MSAPGDLATVPATCGCPDCDCDDAATTTDDGGTPVCAACADYATDDDGGTHCSRCAGYVDEGSWAGGGMSGTGAGWVSRPVWRLGGAR